MPSANSIAEAEEARLYKKLSDGKVRCGLCAHHCVIADGEKGICMVRENRGGTLYTLVYGRTIARHVDPVEKKPLFHFYPGSQAYSMATPGCNFKCMWCQNSEISQMPREHHLLAGEKFSPAQLVDDARQAGCRSIAYTYTEPTIFFEYAYDTARIAHEAGIFNFYITNGFMTEEMLQAFNPYLDGVNVDLKAFKEDTYKNYVGARLKPVLENMKTIKKMGIWLEVTTLIIPGINDESDEIKGVADFIATELGVDTPWHISRFFPGYKMNNLPPTAQSKLEEARKIGREAGLHYIYLGNMGSEENTFCHQCGSLLIRRSSYRVTGNRINDDATCPDCAVEIPGRGMSGSGTE